MKNNLLNTIPKYETWNVFKKEVELKLGHYLDNNLWLQAKPKKPLPWSGYDLEQSILYVKNAEL
jgi:hypothetical protein